MPCKRSVYAHEVLWRFVPSWHARWACGCSSASYDVVSSDGLRRLPRYCFDSLDGRLAHATVLVFGLRAGPVAGEKAWKWVQVVPTSNNIYLLLAYRFARLLFGILDVVRIRLPERALLPAFGEAHAAELTETKAAKSLKRRSRQHVSGAMCSSR